MDGLTDIDSKILGNHLESFIPVKNSGFKTEQVVNLIANWPKISSEFKLQVIADAILQHYKNEASYAKEFSYTIASLQSMEKTSASYRLGQILSSFLHQQWNELPCANLSPLDAYSLFQEHALAPPPFPIHEDLIQTYWIDDPKESSKILKIDHKYPSASDSWISILDAIETPHHVHVVGFQDEKNLELIKRKWPNSHLNILDQEIDIEGILDRPLKTIDIPIDLLIVRHPPKLDSDFKKQFLDLFLKLSENGMVLFSFYSKNQMYSFKEKFKELNIKGLIWNDKLNPFAYNPIFISKNGKYSFDLYLSTVVKESNPKESFLKKLTYEKMRTHEPLRKDLSPRLKKFSFYSTRKLDVITLSGNYQRIVEKQFSKRKMSCLSCKKLSKRHLTFLVRIGGEKTDVSYISFCPEEAPRNKEDLKHLLEKKGYRSNIKNTEIYSFFLIKEVFRNSRY